MPESAAADATKLRLSTKHPPNAVMAHHHPITASWRKRHSLFTPKWMTNKALKHHNACACQRILGASGMQGEVAVATEKATFGAGCFWGVEARFSEMSGVLETAVGYEGGSLSNPSYRDVCTDRTGHAEAVELIYDPKRISYDALLDAFFSLHDPTQVNKQGPDWGTQYRSVIFAHDPQQKREAEAKIAELNASGVFRRPVATTIEPASTFWKAEEYHQKYLEKRNLVSCHI